MTCRTCSHYLPERGICTRYNWDHLCYLPTHTCIHQEENT